MGVKSGPERAQARHPRQRRRPRSSSTTCSVPAGERARRGRPRLQGRDGGAEQRAPRPRRGLRRARASGSSRWPSSACQERHAFGRTIGEFGLIKDKIAAMLAETYALESMTYLTTGIVDARSRDYSLESAICKVFGSETLWRVVNETLQIAAGIGYMQDYPYERHAARRAHQPDLRGHQRDPPLLHRALGHAGPGQGARRRRRRRCASPSRASACSATSRSARRARALGRERMTRAHPLLAREAVIFEEYTGELAQQRRQGAPQARQATSPRCSTRRSASPTWRSISTPSRACLSRTTRAIERRGEEGARREIDLTTIFVAAAQKRLAAERRRRSTSNDDELRKAIADRAYADGGYPFDIL